MEQIVDLLFPNKDEKQDTFCHGEPVKLRQIQQRYKSIEQYQWKRNNETMWTDHKTHNKQRPVFMDRVSHWTHPVRQHYMQ